MIIAKQHEVLPFRHHCECVMHSIAVFNKV